MADEVRPLADAADVELPLEFRAAPGLAAAEAEATFEELATDESRGFGELLQNSEFRLIWGSQIFSQLASVLAGRAAESTRQDQPTRARPRVER